MPKTLLALLSCLLIAFGQPAWDLPAVSIAASIFGYAIFWAQISAISNPKKRFLFGAFWMGAVQLIQASWFISHPYLYIIIIWLGLAVTTGVQFGLLCIAIRRPFIESKIALIFIPSLWTLFEWSRLYWLSGYPWNPAGLSLADTLYTLQTASIAGVYGMTFWVILTNVAALQTYLKPSTKSAFAVVAFSILPFFFGFWQFNVHDQKNIAHESSAPIKALLVQTAFPAEEAFHFEDSRQLANFVLDEWKKIVNLVAEHQGQSFDLIALPEFVVPFGAYSFVYPYKDAQNIFKEAFGDEALQHLPLKNHALVNDFTIDNIHYRSVNNAFFVQSIANLMGAETVAGLEDVEDRDGKRDYYSAALYFYPGSVFEDFPAPRYSKQVLVPMAEYIPTEICKHLAAQYGIAGSFTPGSSPRVAANPKIPYGLSICYEEIFGDLMRQNRLDGAGLLVNITSDVWFPDSKLPRQHFEHARLRTVENGIPLIRACNTGITCSIDSLGRLVDSFKGKHIEDHEWVSKALPIEVSSYTYDTLYTRFGDKLIIAISLLGVLFSAFWSWSKTK